MLNMIELKIRFQKDIKKLKDEEVIAIKSAKKNRMFFVLKDGDQIIFDDCGYGEYVYVVDFIEKEYMHTFKKLVKLEFPRSNKVWYNIITKKQYYSYKSFDEIYEIDCEES